MITYFKLSGAGIAALFLTVSSAQAQPLPENSAACQPSCDSRGADFDPEAALMARANRAYNRGLKQLQRQAFSKAAKQFDKAVRTVPDNGAFNYMAGSSHYLSGNYPTAKARLTAALAATGDTALDPDQKRIAEDMVRKMNAEPQP